MGKFDDKYVIDKFLFFGGGAISKTEAKTLLKATKLGGDKYKENLHLIFEQLDVVTKELVKKHSAGKEFSAFEKLVGALAVRRGRNENEIFTPFVEEYFPICQSKIIGEQENELQEAAFNARVTSTPEFFQEYCSECELILLSSSENTMLTIGNDGFISKHLAQEVIKNINQNYEPMSISHFGYKSLNTQSLLETIKKIGCKQFVENINNGCIAIMSMITDGQHLNGLFYEFSVLGNSLKNVDKTVKIEICEELKKITDISPGIYPIVLPMLEMESEIRKSTRIIECLPARDHTTLVDFFKKVDAHWTSIDAVRSFIKISELELGINNFQAHINSTTLADEFSDDKDIKAILKQGFEFLNQEDKNRFATGFILDKITTVKRGILENYDKLNVLRDIDIIGEKLKPNYLLSGSNGVTVRILCEIMSEDKTVRLCLPNGIKIVNKDVEKAIDDIFEVPKTKTKELEWRRAISGAHGPSIIHTLKLLQDLNSRDTVPQLKIKDSELEI